MTDTFDGTFALTIPGERDGAWEAGARKTFGKLADAIAGPGGGGMTALSIGHATRRALPWPFAPPAHTNFLLSEGRRELFLELWRSSVGRTRLEAPLLPKAMHRQ